MNLENKWFLNKMKYIYFLLFLSIYFCSYSQKIIYGTVLNLKNEPLRAANVVLKNENNELIDYTFTNEIGQFHIAISKLGVFNIEVNSLGYYQKTKNITIKKDDEKTIVNVILLIDVTELEEVFIVNEQSVTIKNDTIVFNAKSFLQGNEQVVEDLLRKIPGLNIDENGTIKVGNHEVEKVMIDGDDMFEKGYKILTKNMPVQPIDKVELYQNYSNNKHLKGIENGDKVALNLTLKEDFKRQWFGNITFGYGLVFANRYEANANLMNFSKKTKYYFLGNANNTGLDATGDINHLIRPFRTNEPGSIGDDQSANTLLGLGFATPNLKQKRTNLNNNEMLSLNSIFTLSSKN